MKKFTLPRIQDEELAGRARVLLVDDDPGVRSVLGRVLATEFEVETAADGGEALGKLGDGIDTIVSDLYMPHLGGLEVLSMVLERGLDIPTILLTGAPCVDTAARAMAVHAFRYLLKPIQAEELVRVVRYSTKVRRNRRRRARFLAMLESSLGSDEHEAHLSFRLDEALDRMWMALQPIRDTQLEGVLGYEALLRTDERSLDDPGEILRIAEQLHRVHDVGRRVRRTVASVLPDLSSEALIFVNLHPNDLEDPDLYSPEAPLARFAHRVVLEITERAELTEPVGLQRNIQRLHALGYRIALDDMGAGYNGLASFCSLVPDVVKLDQKLVRRIHEGPLKLDLVRALVGICRTCNIELIAEGVESEEEYRALRDVDCTLMQGYLFGRPQRVYPASA